jgi:DNA-binding winged helix-turn-helix (wHTH) protein
LSGNARRDLEQPANSFCEVGRSVLVFVGDAAENKEQVRHLSNQDFAMVIIVASAEEAKILMNGTMTDSSPPRGPICFEDLSYDSISRACFTTDSRLRLSEREIRILDLLLKPPGRAVSFEELLNSCWGGTAFRNVDMVRAAVKRLRKKLCKNGLSVRVEAVPGFGYRMAKEVGDGDCPPLTASSDKRGTATSHSVRT